MFNIENYTYIGDGVYIHFDGNGIDIVTWNGLKVTNQIYFESEVLDSLWLFAKHIREGIK